MLPLKYSVHSFQNVRQAWIKHFRNLSFKYPPNYTCSFLSSNLKESRRTGIPHKNVTSRRDRFVIIFMCTDELIFRNHYLYLGASLHYDASKLILAATPIERSFRLTQKERDLPTRRRLTQKLRILPPFRSKRRSDNVRTISFSISFISGTMMR